MSIYIISVNLHAFLLFSSSYRVCIIDFACYYILIRFSICRMILKSVASYSYAETIISDLLNTRSGQGQGRGQDDRVKSIFRSNDCKPPTDDVVDVGIFMMSLVLRYRNSHDMSCRSDVME